ncbi:hypothetical protein EGM51_10630 [Verrucomicrobia bacterium S94]|nr:hypothetical protein EGM51_10630 [Verrucomicrobia bacterium S94]
MLDSRTDIITGPAVIKKGSTILYTEENVVVTAEVATVEGRNSVMGKYDEFQSSVLHTVSFKPAPMATQAYFDVLFPYHTPVLGSSIYGATPDDIVVWSVDGKEYTYKHGALTQMPGLAFGADLPLYDGEAVFTCLGDCTEAWSGTDHFSAVQSKVFTDTSFDRTKDLRLHYAAAWGESAPWDDIETEGGVVVSFNLELADKMNDAYGIADKKITGLSVTATFVPQGITPEQVLTALGVQGIGARRGRSMYGLAKDLVLAGEQAGDPTFTLSKAVISNNVSNFGAESNRVGELSLVSLNGMNSQVFSLGLIEE